MTQEEKQLLIKDISSRLPYCVEAQVNNNIDGETKSFVVNKELTFDDVNSFINNDAVCDIKPYLRPMSSMTDEEFKTYEYFFDEDGLIDCSVDVYIDWLLEGHFDFRGLIPKGLALEAPEGMYAIK